MQKILNTFLLLLIFFFFGFIYKFYSSNKNIEIKEHNRSNFEKVFNNKISNLPILKNDTSNVIEFNDGFSNELKNDKPRSFWNLLKSE